MPKGVLIIQAQGYLHEHKNNLHTGRPWPIHFATNCLGTQQAHTQQDHKTILGTKHGMKSYKPTEVPPQLRAKLQPHPYIHQPINSNHSFFYAEAFFVHTKQCRSMQVHRSTYRPIHPENACKKVLWTTSVQYILQKKCTKYYHACTRKPTGIHIHHHTANVSRSHACTQLHHLEPILLTKWISKFRDIIWWTTTFMLTSLQALCPMSESKRIQIRLECPNCINAYVLAQAWSLIRIYSACLSCSMLWSSIWHCQPTCMPSLVGIPLQCHQDRGR